jgi:tellurite resistance-related uncharacterized protein
MKHLPYAVKHYKNTPEFTQDTVPQALQRGHTTAEQVSGRIVVSEGSLRYVVDQAEPETYLLGPGEPGMIEPQMLHHVEVIGPVRFCVEFHR